VNCPVSCPVVAVLLLLAGSAPAQSPSAAQPSSAVRPLAPAQPPSAAQPSSPAQSPSAVLEPSGLPGPLVIVGGGPIPADARQAFVELAGLHRAKIVVIPTASIDADDPQKAGEFLKPWQELKPGPQPGSVVLLHTRDAATANDADFVRPLTEATGVWFSGGDQGRITAAYRGTLVEKELKKLHERGGVIGGTSAGASVLSDLMITGGGDTARTGAGLGLLPGFVIDQHFVRRGRVKRLAGLIDANPSYVGLGIDEATALVVRGRLARVLGDSTVTVCLGKGAGRPATRQEYRAGELLDLLQLRRAAANRAAAEPFPPARPGEPVVEKGTLVIVGGGRTPPEVMDTFFQKAGGKDALIVAVPTTAASGPGDVRYLQSFGARNVKLLHPHDRKQADDPQFSEPLLKAGGVWFGGGRQWNFVDSYEGTLTEKRFHDVLRRGGVIGGSSAGASIQGEYMPRGHPLGNTVMAAEGYERGFGFLPGCAIDQHFFARKRTADMTGLMKQYPQYLGIGIDEATAVVVTGSVAEVLGRSTVAFYDYSKKPDGDKDYVELKAGERYDLKKRVKLEK
jgi:cyanophycinase